MPRAIVIGGSISGLYAALMLQRHGWQVDVFERTPGELASRGAGIVAQPELTTALAAAGVVGMGAVGVSVATRILLDRDGRTLLRISCPQTVTSWQHIHRLLRNSLSNANYHAGYELAGIDLAADRPKAFFVGGTSIDADLIIGADGIRSTVRRQLFPRARIAYAGYVAWRSLVDERDLSPATHASIFWQFAFSLPEGEQFLGYPVTGPDDDMTPGRLRYNFVWYRPAEEHTELRRLLTDTSGRVHSMSIPPPLIRADVRAQLRAAAASRLPPEFREVVELSPEAFLQPIYDLESDCISSANVAIIGDAAFVARPHVAAGVIKAVDDVAALVCALDAGPDVATALARFQTERVPVGKRIVARARAMGENYRPASTGRDGIRLSGNDRDYAHSVVADTALTTFLRE